MQLHHKYTTNTVDYLTTANFGLFCGAPPSIRIDLKNEEAPGPRRNLPVPMVFTNFCHTAKGVFSCIRNITSADVAIALFYFALVSLADFTGVLCLSVKEFLII
jgi:hypothetical protein